MPAQRDKEVAAIRDALDLGYRIIDTAERYANGGAERVIAGALEAFGRGRRTELFIVSKVTDINATRSGTVQACEASIRRMDCEYLDMYLLHSEGPHPVAETLAGFQELQKRGLARRVGVSNFNEDQLRRWLRAEKSLGFADGGIGCNQIPYSTEKRGIENGLLAWQRVHGIRTMAYSPLGQGRLAQHPLLARIGRERGASAAQVALAWCLRQPDVVAVVKSARPERLEENLRAGELRLTAEELEQIDRAFPVRLRWLRQNRWLRQARSASREMLRVLKQRGG